MIDLIDCDKFITLRKFPKQKFVFVIFVVVMNLFGSFFLGGYIYVCLCDQYVLVLFGARKRIQHIQIFEEKKKK